MFKLHIPIFYRNKYQMALEWWVCINFAKPRERERDKCFVTPISLQQRKHFMAIRGRLCWLKWDSHLSLWWIWQTLNGKIILINLLKRTGLFVFGKIGQLCLIVFSFSIGNFCFVEIFLDVYFVLDASKYNNNFMKQNCIDTLVRVVILVSDHHI